jgi:hypothetical protein
LENYAQKKERTLRSRWTKEPYGQDGRKNLMVKMGERTVWSRWTAASNGFTGLTFIIHTYIDYQLFFTIDDAGTVVPNSCNMAVVTVDGNQVTPHEGNT